MRPKLFIGSSAESLEVAYALQTELDRTFECTVWSQGLFAPGRGTLESLVDAADQFDFAILVALAEDTVRKRRKQSMAPRDNILFELGLFIGVLGRVRTFFLYDRNHPPALPSDLAGVTPLTFVGRSDGNLQAAVGPACQALRIQAKAQGPRRVDQFAGMGAVELCNLAAVWVRQGQWHDALDACDRAIKEDADYDAAYDAKIGLLRKLGRYDEAVRVGKAAAERFPNSARIFGQVGFALWSKKDYEQALTWFDRALAIAPLHDLSRFYRGMTLESLSRLEEAAAEYRRLMTDGSSREFLTRSSLQLGKIEALWREGREAGPPTVASDEGDVD